MHAITKRFLRGAGAHGALALMYHSTRQRFATSLWRWAVELPEFLRQLDLLQEHGWRTVPLSALAQGDTGPRTVALTFDDGYADNLAAVEALSARGMCASWFVVTDYIGGRAGWPGSERPKLPMLSCADLLDMARAGMEIGSHTLSHADLSVCRSDSLRAEVAGSKARLEDLLGQPVASFAYPYGRESPAAASAVQAAGYKAAVTTRSGRALLDNDPMQIRRLTMWAGESIGCFARKLAFADNDGSWRRVARYALERALESRAKADDR
jgi:peptidoglycan/xylan/chitin deacetylase (PgdA/CDA1 family)